MKPRIISVCGDPGGARALIPVIELLEKNSRVDLKHFAYSAAMDVMLQSGLVVNPLHASVANRAGVGIIMEDFLPNLLLTATSMHELAFEKKFIQQAQQMVIPSLSVVDFWSNYPMRFNDSSGKLKYLPTKIAVLDPYSKAQMLQQGFPDDRIVITGQPAFEQMEKMAGSAETFDPRQVKSEYGLNPDDRLVLFYSQPIRKYFYGTPAYPGFDEHTVLQDLVKIMQNIQYASQIPAVLGIIPHPTQQAENFIEFKDKCTFILQPSQSSQKLMISADLILGMTSSRLMEAFISNRPVLSLQPNCSEVFQFPQTAYGNIPILTEIENISKQIIAKLNHKTDEKKPAGKTSHEHIGASEKIENLIYQLLDMNEHGTEKPEKSCH